MTLVNLSTLLKKAKEEKYAVGAFNATDLNTARGILEAAEELNSPVILQFAESHSPYITLEMAADMYLPLARKSKVPVCVHLDHGESFNTIIRAMKKGFTSVMVDASLEEFDVNVERTSEVKKIAEALGVSVEAELGVMNAEVEDEVLDYSTLKSNYTDPEKAKVFVEQTNVDALAIAFGTVHGLYKGKPNLDFDVVKNARSKTNLPLVMHGGSGLSDEEYRSAIENGVAKINYYSTMAYDVTNNLRDYLNNNNNIYLHDVNLQVIQYVKENIREKMKIFGSENKA